MDACADTDRPWFIYFLEDPRTKEVRYVGKTHQRKQYPSRPEQALKIRFNAHMHMAKTGNRRHVYSWIRSLLSIGLRPCITIAQVGCGNGSGEAEKNWIAFGRALGVRLTNLTDGGDGPIGQRLSADSIALLKESLRLVNADPATKAKRSAATKAAWQDQALRNRQSESHRGKTPWNKGLKATPAARLAQSIAHRGLKQKPETIAKRVAKVKGQRRRNGYVSPMKGKKRPEGWVNPLKGKKRNGWVSPMKGKKRPEGWVNPLKGKKRPPEVVALLTQRRWYPTETSCEPVKI